MRRGVQQLLIRRPFLRNLLHKLFSVISPFSIRSFASASVCARLDGGLAAVGGVLEVRGCPSATHPKQRNLPVLLANCVEIAICHPWNIPRLPMQRRHVDAQAISKAEILCQKFHVGMIYGLALVPGFGIRQKLSKSCGGSSGHLLTRRLPFRSIG